MRELLEWLWFSDCSIKALIHPHPPSVLTFLAGNSSLSSINYMVLSTNGQPCRLAEACEQVVSLVVWSEALFNLLRFSD